jgi:transcriptional regulator with XRE-family HTH domain
LGLKKYLLTTGTILPKVVYNVNIFFYFLENNKRKHTMTPDEIKEKLRLMNLSQVAKESGVSRNMLHRFVNQKNKSPYERTVERLAQYLGQL